MSKLLSIFEVHRRPFRGARVEDLVDTCAFQGIRRVGIGVERLGKSYVYRGQQGVIRGSVVPRVNKLTRLWVGRGGTLVAAVLWEGDLSKGIPGAFEWPNLQISSRSSDRRAPRCALLGDFFRGHQAGF